MGNWIKRQEMRRKRQEGISIRREKLSGYFFNLSQLTYTALVLGALVLFFQSERITGMLVIMLITGAVLATGLALIGNELLKKVGL